MKQAGSRLENISAVRRKRRVGIPYNKRAYKEKKPLETQNGEGLREWTVKRQKCKCDFTIQKPIPFKRRKVEINLVGPPKVCKHIL